MNELEWRACVAKAVDEATGDRFDWSVVPERVMREGYAQHRDIEQFARELQASYGDNHALQRSERQYKLRTGS